MMKHTLGYKLGRLPLGLFGFVLGSVLVGAAFAQSTATPPQTFSTREQNLDANGFIRVHEQGVLKADVNVSNFPNSVSVSNFPATQNVKVTGGEVLAKTAPVTTGFSTFMELQPKEYRTIELPSPINATNISLGKENNSAALYFMSDIPVSGGGNSSIGPTVFQVIDFGGKVPVVNHAFTRPVPIKSVFVNCVNTFQSCFIDLAIIGDPGV